MKSELNYYELKELFEDTMSRNVKEINNIYKTLEKKSEADEDYEIVLANLEKIRADYNETYSQYKELLGLGDSKFVKGIKWVVKKLDQIDPNVVLKGCFMITALGLVIVAERDEDRPAILRSKAMNFINFKVL